MEFETSVLAAVEAVLNQERKACFWTGTLIVECSQDKALELYQVLSETSPIEISGPIAGEYYYDFVA